MRGLGVSSLLVYGTDIFAAGNVGLFRSPDGGDQWIASGLLDESATVLASNGIQLFAGTGHGVYRSDDNGGNWMAHNSGLITTDVRALIVNGSEIIAGTMGGGVFHSTDNGTNWNTVNADGLPTGVYFCKLRASAGPGRTEIYSDTKKLLLLR